MAGVTILSLATVTVCQSCSHHALFMSATLGPKALKAEAPSSGSLHAALAQSCIRGSEMLTGWRRRPRWSSGRCCAAAGRPRSAAPPRFPAGTSPRRTRRPLQWAQTRAVRFYKVRSAAYAWCFGYIKQEARQPVTTFNKVTSLHAWPVHKRTSHLSNSAMITCVDQTRHAK